MVWKKLGYDYTGVSIPLFVDSEVGCDVGQNPNTRACSQAEQTTGRGLNHLTPKI